MRNHEDVKRMVADQSELRQQLFDYWLVHPMSNAKFCKEIGFSVLTLRRFLEHQVDISAVNLMKIKNYLDKKVD